MSRPPSQRRLRRLRLPPCGYAWGKPSRSPRCVDAGWSRQRRLQRADLRRRHQRARRRGKRCPWASTNRAKSQHSGVPDASVILLAGPENGPKGSPKGRNQLSESKFAWLLRNCEHARHRRAQSGPTFGAFELVRIALSLLFLQPNARCQGLGCR